MKKIQNMDVNSLKPNEEKITVMSEENKKLRSIALEYLFEGMVLSEDIYNYNGAVLLISKENTLTVSKIKQLKEFNAFQRNISVHPETYDMLIRQTLNPFNALQQEYMEKSTGYTDIKEQTGNMLSKVIKSNAVQPDRVGQIAGEILSKLKEIDPALVFQCINAPNPIDEYLRRHSVNVGLLNGMMGEWLKLDQRIIEQMIIAGLVHDIGKTRIPIDIIDAPRKLTHSEFEVMKMHPIYSYDLLNSEQRFSEEIKLAARHHHEKMNGDGYPDGLVADKISIFARITAVSDVYDAMISKRSYKEADSPFSVLARLAKQQFSQLDMRFVKLFIDHMPMELIGKSVLMSDGSIGVVKFVINEDIENPIVDVNGEVKKTDAALYCKRIIFDS